ncbi:MAG: RibD family protein, partial [Mariprofundus sp.]
LQLYPVSDHKRSLKGLYTDLKLNEQAEVGNVLIYSNYIASIDGRISIRDSDSDEFIVPEAIANPRDWRLYQELAAQADVMLTSARYFRQLARGKAQDLLPVGSTSAYADLREWRIRRGLEPQPDVMVISNSLDIPSAALESVQQDRRVIMVSSEQANTDRVARLESLGVTVLIAGPDRVGGLELKQLLVDQGFRSAYMIAGPQVHRTLIADGVLDYMFLTTHLSLLGEDSFHTILSGELEQAVCLQLCRLYLDQCAAPGQLFAQFALHPD